MSDNAALDALSLWKAFETDTFFPEPLGRNFSTFADALKRFVEGDQKDLGGLIGPRTSKRQFKKQLELLVDVAVAWVQRAAAKDAYTERACSQTSSRSSPKTLTPAPRSCSGRSTLCLLSKAGTQMHLSLVPGPL